MNTINNHPTSPTLTLEQLAEWPNCSVVKCPAKVTHFSDKCYPHTHGWEAVRRNVRERLSLAEDKYAKHKTQQLRDEIKWCKDKLTEIKDNV